MLDINRTQKKVIKDFMLHVEHILDPHRHFNLHGRTWRRPGTANGAGSSMYVLPVPLLISENLRMLSEGNSEDTSLNQQANIYAHRSPDEGASDSPSGYRRHPHPHPHQHSSSFSNHHGTEEHADKTDDPDDKRQIYEWFKVNAEELVAKVVKRIEDLEVLERTAQSTASSVSLCFDFEFSVIHTSVAANLCSAFS